MQMSLKIGDSKCDKAHSPSRKKYDVNDEVSGCVFVRDRSSSVDCLFSYQKKNRINLRFDLAEFQMKH